MEIDEQFVAYALQKHVRKLDNSETYILFLKSKLWTHSVKIDKYEFDSIFEKICFKKETPIESSVSIMVNWKIINATKGQS